MPVKQGEHQKPICKKMEKKGKVRVLHFKSHILQVCLSLQGSVYEKMLQADSKFFSFPYF